MEKQFEVAAKDMNELKEIINEGAKQSASTYKKYAKKFNFGGNQEDGAKAREAGQYVKTIKLFNALLEGDSNTAREISRESASNEARKKALTEGAASGSYLVPEEFEAKVYAALDDHSQIRRYATVVPMSSDVKRLNSLSTKPTAYKVSEIANITSSQATFAEPVLTAEKYMAAGEMSSEILEDGEVDLINILARVYGERIAYAEQNSFINSVVSGSEGLLTVSGVTATTLATGTSYAFVDYDDLATLQANIFAFSPSEAGTLQFIMGFGAYNTLRTSKSSGDGNYFVMPAAPTAGTPATAWGRPIIVLPQVADTTATSTKFVIATDLANHFVIGDRTGLTIKVAEEGTLNSVNLLQQDAKALVMRKRTAQVCVLPAGIATLATFTS